MISEKDNILFTTILKKHAVAVEKSLMKQFQTSILVAQKFI